MRVYSDALAILYVSAMSYVLVCSDPSSAVDGSTLIWG